MGCFCPGVRFASFLGFCSCYFVGLGLGDLLGADGLQVSPGKRLQFCALGLAFRMEFLVELSIAFGRASQGGCEIVKWMTYPGDLIDELAVCFVVSCRRWDRQGRHGC